MTPFPCQPVCPQLHDSRVSYPPFPSLFTPCLPPISCVPFSYGWGLERRSTEHPHRPEQPGPSRVTPATQASVSTWTTLDVSVKFYWGAALPYPSIAPVFSCFCITSELSGCHTDTEAASPKRSHHSKVCPKSPSSGHLLKPGQETTGWL